MTGKLLYESGKNLAEMPNQGMINKTRQNQISSTSMEGECLSLLVELV